MSQLSHHHHRPRILFIAPMYSASRFWHNQVFMQVPQYAQGHGSLVSNCTYYYDHPFPSYRPRIQYILEQNTHTLVTTDRHPDAIRASHKRRHGDDQMTMDWCEEHMEWWYDNIRKYARVILAIDPDVRDSYWEHAQRVLGLDGIEPDFNVKVG